MKILKIISIIAKQFKIVHVRKCEDTNKVETGREHFVHSMTNTYYNITNWEMNIKNRNRKNKIKEMDRKFQKGKPIKCE